MHLAVMRAAQRHCKFVADFTTKRLGLCKTQVVGVGWLSAAYQARLARDKLAAARKVAWVRTGARPRTALGGLL